MPLLETTHSLAISYRNISLLLLNISHSSLLSLFNSSSQLQWMILMLFSKCLNFRSPISNFHVLRNRSWSNIFSNNQVLFLEHSVIIFHFSYILKQLFYSYAHTSILSPNLFKLTVPVTLLSDLNRCKFKFCDLVGNIFINRYSLISNTFQLYSQLSS